MSDLPVKMLELVLMMRAFLIIYVTDMETDDGDVGRHRYKWWWVSSFTVLSSVSSYWHLALSRWPDSPTGQWVRHKLRKLIQCNVSSMLRALLEIANVTLMFQLYEQINWTVLCGKCGTIFCNVMLAGLTD